MDTANAPPRPGQALCEFAGAQLDAARDALGWTGDDLHEGVHRARKSIRRTRAVLALGDRLLGPGFELVDAQLRQLNDSLSPLRDAHALVETLQRLLDARIAAKTRDALLRALAVAVAARALATEQALALDPGLRQRQSLLRVLGAALSALDWTRLTPSSVRMGVADSDDRAQRARKRVIRRGSEADWHRWRRRVRRAGQQRNALIEADIALAQADAFDKRTAERLGNAQDLSLLIDHCGQDSLFSKRECEQLLRYARPALQRLRRRLEVAALD